MQLLIAFSPFLAFLIGQHLVGLVPALCAGAATAGALVARGRLRGARELNVLEAGTALLFAGLALAATFRTDVAWSVGLVRLVVDIGLLLLVLVGVAVGRPFTLAFARERVTPEVAASPRLLDGARRVALAWAGAFVVLAAADVVLLLWPQGPLIVPVAISAPGLLAAARFTLRTLSKARPAA